jgi:glycosyltransferase involved in cell wall biosynthesis
MNGKVFSKNQSVILFSTADWDNPFWTNKQHTAVQLAEKGFRVFYVESLGLRQPQLKLADIGRIFKRIRKLFIGAHEVRPGLFVYSPLVIPLHRFAWVRRLNQFLLRKILRFYQRKLGLGQPWIWTYNPIILDLARALNPSKIIYHSVDDLAAAPGVDRETILQNESRLLDACDAVFCTSRKIETHCKAMAPLKTYYFGNVVDYDHFKKAQSPQKLPEDLIAISRPRIGFIGALSSYKFDVAAVLEVASTRPEWQWVLIGKVGEGQPDAGMESLKGQSNIHFLGPMDYIELPQYLAHFDAAVIPCPLNEYTRSMFPMKFFEYMAAGRPIVARRIDSLEEHLAYYRHYEDSKSLESALEASLCEGVIDPAGCDSLARENTWTKRLDKMLGIIG